MMLWTFMLVLMGSPASLLPAPDVAPSTNAGCIVRVGDRVLMVQDVWSRRWGLPGGGADAGETLAATAARETFEETGVQVTATELVGTTAGFSAFTCVPASPIGLLAQQTLMLPNAARTEIAKARLVDPHTLAAEAWRFPAQRDHLLNWLQDVAPLADAMVRPAVVVAPPVFFEELTVNMALQRLTSNTMDKVMNLASGLGALNAVVIMGVAVWYFMGWRRGLDYLLLALFASLLAVVCKELLGWPRPCYLDPALQRESVSSFGCPSGHSVVAATLWGALALRSKIPGRLALALLMPLCCGVARLYWGSHFVHDVLAAWLLVGVVLATYSACLRWHDAAWLPCSTWLVGIGSVGALALIAAFTPATVLLLMAALGLGLGTLFCPLPDPGASSAAPWRVVNFGLHQGVGALVAVLAVLAVRAGWLYLPPSEGTFLASLAHCMGLHFCLGLTLPWVTGVQYKLGLLGAQPFSCPTRLVS